MLNGGEYEWRGRMLSWRCPSFCLEPLNKTERGCPWFTSVPPGTCWESILKQGITAIFHIIQFHKHGILRSRREIVLKWTNEPILITYPGTHLNKRRKPTKTLRRFSTRWRLVQKHWRMKIRRVIAWANTFNPGYLQMLTKCSFPAVHVSSGASLAVIQSASVFWPSHANYTFSKYCVQKGHKKCFVSGWPTVQI
jgi:hypothetical protein